MTSHRSPHASGPFGVISLQRPRGVLAPSGEGVEVRDPFPQTQRGDEGGEERMVGLGKSGLQVIKHRLHGPFRERAFVLKDGFLVETGTHRQLMDKRGEFYRLAQLGAEGLFFES